MTTITILPESLSTNDPSFRAMAGGKVSVGKTAGQALDALAGQLPDTDPLTLVVVQKFRPDGLFSAEQQGRLAELMAKWREKRDQGSALDATEQKEFDELVNAEMRGTMQQTAAMLHGLDR